MQTFHLHLIWHGKEHFFPSGHYQHLVDNALVIHHLNTNIHEHPKLDFPANKQQKKNKKQIWRLRMKSLKHLNECKTGGPRVELGIIILNFFILKIGQDLT